jgi:AcrR family transcriptional regulator
LWAGLPSVSRREFEIGVGRMVRKGKAAIVEAGRAALIERGIAQLRLADVAGAAGVTPPGVLYHYPDMPALFDEAFDVSVQEYCEQRRRAVERFAGPRERLRACIASGVPRTRAQLDTTRLLIELQPYVLRAHAQAQRWQSFIDEQVEIYAAVLDDGVVRSDFVLVDDARRIGEDLVMLEDGFAGSVVAGTRSADYVEERMWEFAATACSIS